MVPFLWFLYVISSGGIEPVRIGSIATVLPSFSRSANRPILLFMLVLFVEIKPAENTIYVIQPADKKNWIPPLIINKRKDMSLISIGETHF